MRSVMVVFPLSMCALIPKLRRIPLLSCTSELKALDVVKGL
jgi:hypothetical protein